MILLASFVFVYVARVVVLFEILVNRILITRLTEDVENASLRCILDGIISFALLTQSCLLDSFRNLNNSIAWLRGYVYRTASKLDDQPVFVSTFRFETYIYLSAATLYLTPSIFPFHSHLSSFLRLQFFRRFFECLAFPATISHPPLPLPPHGSSPCYY